MKEKKRKTDKNLAYYLLIAIYIIGISALGLLLVNQFLAYQYNIQLLSSPCDLCEDLNPDFEVVPKQRLLSTGTPGLKINLTGIINTSINEAT